MSFSHKPSLVAWLESRCLSGTLARKIAVVVCTVLALATAVLVELDWHHDRAEETSSPQVSGRSAGVFASARPSTPSISPPTSGWAALSAGGESLTCAHSVATSVSRSKGGSPAKHS